MGVRSEIIDKSTLLESIRLMDGKSKSCYLEQEVMGQICVSGFYFFGKDFLLLPAAIRWTGNEDNFPNGTQTAKNNLKFYLTILCFF